MTLGAQHRRPYVWTAREPNRSTITIQEGTLTTARDIMHAGVTCIGEHETLSADAHQMRDLGIRALPIWADDDRLHEMITDRDIGIKCLAAERDPRTTIAGELAQGSTYHIGGDAGIEQMLAVMEDHQIRRLPVIDNHRLVGMISEADIARHLPEHGVAEFVKAICAPQPISVP